MIDFFYLGDYDPDVITKNSSTSPADENNATMDSSCSFQQEAVRYDTVTETEREQREDTEPGPESRNADPSADQPEDRTLSVKKKKKKGRAKLLNDDWSPPVLQPGIGEPKSLPAERPLTTHAKMYSIAAKYSIKPLMDTRVRHNQSRQSLKLPLS
jgi:hypothetical protein